MTVLIGPAVNLANSLIDKCASSSNEKSVV